MKIKVDTNELANDLAHWRIANEIRLPLDEVIMEDEDGATTYTPKIMKLYNHYKEHYLTVLESYEKIEDK